MTIGDPTCPIHGQALCHCTPGEKLGALMAPHPSVLLVERLTRERDEARAELASLRRELRGFQAQDDRLAALLAGTPEATQPAPLVARVVSYCAGLAAERDELVDQLSLSADTIESLLPQRYPGLAEVFRAETQRDAIRAVLAKYEDDAPGPTGERDG